MLPVIMAKAIANRVSSVFSGRWKKTPTTAIEVIWIINLFQCINSKWKWPLKNPLKNKAAITKIIQSRRQEKKAVRTIMGAEILISN